MADLNVFFVTNRNHQPANKVLAFGSQPNPDGIAALRFGRAYFTDADQPKLQKVDVYEETRAPSSALIAGGSASFHDDIRSEMKSGKTDTLVFIHGFNVSFEDALVSAAKLAKHIRIHDKPVNVVVFTWPSDGSAVPFMSYYSDREDARASGPALARAFLKLRDFIVEMDETAYCNHSLHLLAHSMGNYVLRNGLQALMAKDPSSMVRLFDQIVLAAPDEDDDAFESDQKLRLLPRIGRQVTVYFNPRDTALLISDKTKANPDRLGSDGPRLVDLLPKKITLVNCGVVGGTSDRVIQHSYYINSPAVRSDLISVLRGIDNVTIGNRRFDDHIRAFRILAEVAQLPA